VARLIGASSSKRTVKSDKIERLKALDESRGTLTRVLNKQSLPKYAFENIIVAKLKETNRNNGRKRNCSARTPFASEA
jgi:hypothetical protein